MDIDPTRPMIEGTVDDENVLFMYVETWDGLYAPIGVRKPEGAGPFPIVLLASGNGGEAMGWIRDAFENRGYIVDRLVEAGYAAAWIRYRTEVELGYNNGGPLVRDMRQGRELFNRSPLEYEDEIAIIDFVKTLDWVDADRVGLVGIVDFDNGRGTGPKTGPQADQVLHLHAFPPGLEAHGERDVAQLQLQLLFFVLLFDSHPVTSSRLCFEP